MSITLPPPPDATYDIGEGFERIDAYSLVDLQLYGLAAVIADRASRVPMADDPRVEDLAMLVKRLVHSVRLTSPDNVAAYSAMGYLDRMGLIGSPLREQTVDGLELAAAWVQKRLDAYDSDHGSTDPETGTREYGRNGAGEEYVGELQEIIEGIRGIGAKP